MREAPVNKESKMANCACNANDTLIFACSGAADVGALSYTTARALSQEGKGKMFCSVGIGGRSDHIMEKTRKASQIVAIDGCPMDCMKKTLENAGFHEYRHIRITDHGFVKGKTVVDETAVTRAKNIVSRVTQR